MAATPTTCRALFRAVQPGENFHASRLYDCFFNGLNTVGEDAGLHSLEELVARRGQVPFLNGGLFDLEDALDVRGAVEIPNAAFERIFSLFESFNFTVEESTPLDVQVSVDPEMLGKVFEELVTGRHESGSYYTPRGIVAWMCREALKGFLAPLDSAEALSRFVDDDDARDLRDPEAVLDALRRVKVCDPACGSGAYLLGMMKELLRLRAGLFVSHHIDAQSEYDKKLEVIQHNLYGVDADRFAANIAMLRLWLALVIEYDGDNPPPLPNLGYKIGVGDSLLAPDPNAFNLHAAEYARLCPRVEALHGEMFALGINKRKGKPVRAKAAIEADIAVLSAEIRANFGNSAPKTSFDWRCDFAEVFAPREEATTIFGTLNVGGGQLVAPAEPGGFDIVLANPPYVRQELIRDLKPALKEVYPHVYTGVADLYVYFYARALQLLRPGGMLAFISSNKWFRAGYGAKLREHIAGTTSVRSITDFGELPVFENAATFPMIFVAQKHGADEEQATSAVELTRWTPVKSLAPPYPDVRQVVQAGGQLLPAEALNGNEWTLADARTAKRLTAMRASGTPLGEYVDGQIFYGVKTGFNEAFVLDGATRAQLIAQDARSAELIKPMAKGDDIRRWRIEQKDRWLIYSPWELKIDNYPAIKQHLEKWKTELSARPECQQGRYNWWCMARYGAEYVEEFSKPKIMYPVVGKEPRFTLDNGKTFTNDKGFIIASEDLFLLGVLNSSSVWSYLKATCSALGDADEAGRLELRSIYSGSGCRGYTWDYGRPLQLRPSSSSGRRHRWRDEQDDGTPHLSGVALDHRPLAGAA